MIKCGLPKCSFCAENNSPSISKKYSEDINKMAKNAVDIAYKNASKTNKIIFNSVERNKNS